MGSENQVSEVRKSALPGGAGRGHGADATAGPGKILVLDLGQLGDVVMSLPALAAIRQRFPRARITVAAGQAAGQAIELSGLADEVLSVDRVALRDGPKLRSIARVFKLTATVRRARFDLVIDLRSFWETNLLGFLSGAPTRLFANRGHRSLDLLATIRVPREDRSRHLVDRYLDVVAPLGIHGAPRIPRLAARETRDAEAAQNLLPPPDGRDSRPLIGFFPGAGHASRCWPLAQFAEVASLLERQDEARCVLILGPEEQALAAQARASFPAETIVVEGESLAQFVAVAARLDLFISNDTGPMHVAAAVGTPVLVILGTRQAENLLYMPVGDQHRIVARPAIGEITVAEVYQAARGILAALHKPAR
jgi:ADP-heptose:LPS heptosyltransferase